MARIRSLKPDFFKDEDLADLSFQHRLLFQGLWCWADREGRLKDRPRFLKVEIFPYDKMNVDSMLDDLHERGFVHRYEINGEKFIHIPKFSVHQRPNVREAESEIPACADTCLHVQDRVEGKGRERKGKEGEARADGRVKHSHEEFVESLKSNPAYKSVDIDRELSKMDAWLQTPKGRRRQKTKGFILNWLNRIDQPMETEDGLAAFRREAEEEAREQSGVS